MNNELSINVGMKTFDDLLSLKLSIPDFQRSYVWKESNLKKLINDFEEFLSSNKDEYYMGTILLYRNIDGEGVTTVNGNYCTAGIKK